MTDRIKITKLSFRLWYFKKCLDYGGFKTLLTLEITAIYMLIPILTLVYMGIGFPSIPLGIGICFCSVSLILREDRMKAAYVTSIKTTASYVEEIIDDLLELKENKEKRILELKEKMRSIEMDDEE